MPKEYPGIYIICLAFSSYLGSSPLCLQLSHMTQLLEDLAVWPELGLHCSNGNKGSLGQVVTVRREEFKRLKLRLPAKLWDHLTLSRIYTTEVGSNFLSNYFSEEKVGPALYLDLNLNWT